MACRTPVWGEVLEAGRTVSVPARRYLAATALLWVGRGVQAVLFNLHLVAIGFSEAFVGRSLGVLGVGVAAAALPAASLAERWGRRRTLLAGFVLEGVGTFGRVAVPEPAVILAASLLLGAGMAVIAVAGLPFLTEHSTSAERPFLFSGVQSVSLVGQVAGSVVGGGLPMMLAVAGHSVALRPDSAPRAVLIGSALVIAAAGWPLLTIRRLHEPTTTAGPARLPEAARQVVRRAIPVFFLTGAGIGLVVPFMNLYFSQRYGASTAAIGVYFSLAAVATAAASLAGAGIGRRFGALRTVACLQLLALPFLAVLGVGTALVAAVAAFLIGATLMRVGLPLLQSAVMTAVPARSAAWVSGIVFLAWSVGWSASAAGAGALIERTGFAGPLLLAAGLYAASSLALGGIVRGQPPRRPTSPLSPTGLDPR